MEPFDINPNGWRGTADAQKSREKTEHLHGIPKQGWELEYLKKVGDPSLLYFRT